MRSIEWINLINDKKGEIIAAGKSAYRDALENHNMRFIIEIYEDGAIETWGDVAGGNSYHKCRYEDGPVELMTFCCQYWELPINDDLIAEVMEDNGLNEQLGALEQERAEDWTTLEYLIKDHHKELEKVLKECISRLIDLEVENCFEMLEYQYKETIKTLKYYAEQELMEGVA